MKQVIFTFIAFLGSYVPAFAARPIEELQFAPLHFEGNTYIASAFGSGFSFVDFFPSTFWGWMGLTLFIYILMLMYNRYKYKTATLTIEKEEE